MTELSDVKVNDLEIAVGDFVHVDAEGLVSKKAVVDEPMNV